MTHLTPSQIAEMFPGRSSTGTLSPSTVLRWIRVGCRDIKLKSIRIGGTIMVARTDLDAFLAAINDGPDQVSDPMSTEIADAIAKANLAAHHGIFVP